jgi:hypothetical protein
LLRKERKEGSSWAEGIEQKEMSRETIRPEGEEHVQLSGSEEN